MSLCLSTLPGSCYKDGLSTWQVHGDVRKPAQSAPFSRCGLRALGSGSAMLENVRGENSPRHVCRCSTLKDTKENICSVPTSQHSCLIFKYKTKVEELLSKPPEQTGHDCFVRYLQLPERQVCLCVFA